MPSWRRSQARVSAWIFPLPVGMADPRDQLAEIKHDNPGWINTVTAKERGIENGDKIRVYNDLGEVIEPDSVARLGHTVLRGEFGPLRMIQQGTNTQDHQIRASRQDGRGHSPQRGLRGGFNHEITHANEFR